MVKGENMKTHSIIAVAIVVLMAGFGFMVFSQKFQDEDVQGRKRYSRGYCQELCIRKY